LNASKSRFERSRDVVVNRRHIHAVSGVLVRVEDVLVNQIAVLGVNHPRVRPGQLVQHDLDEYRHFLAGLALSTFVS